MAYGVILNQKADSFTKKETLSPETAESIGLGAEAVPDEAFAALSPKVGDVKITAREDLGANWLECNGETIDGNNYVGIKSLLPSQVAGTWDKEGSVSPYSMEFFFGKWWYVSSSNIGKVYYTDNLSSTWNSTTATNASTGLATNGNTLVAYGRMSGNRMGYSWRSSGAEASWSDVSGFGNMLSPSKVFAAKNNYYLAKSNSAMVFTNDLSNSNWQSYGGATYYDDYSIASSYAENVAGAIDTIMFASGDRTEGAYRIMGDTPETWGEYGRGNESTKNVQCAEWVNGYWVVGKNNSTIYFTNDPRVAGSWEKVVIDATRSGYYIQTIGYFDGCYWVVDSDGKSYWAKSLNGKWNIANVPARYVCYGYNDDRVAVYSSHNGIFTAKAGYRALPDMTFDKTKAFIKVK